MSSASSSEKLPYTLLTLEIYTKTYINRTLAQLDKELETLNMERKLSKNLENLKILFKNVKKGIGSWPSIDILFARIKSAILHEVYLDEIIDKNNFIDLVGKVGRRQAYSILAWGIIKFYLLLERVPHPSIFIKYDP